MLVAENENARNNKEPAKTSQATPSSGICMISPPIFFREACVLNCHQHPKTFAPYFCLCCTKCTKVISFAEK